MSYGEDRASSNQAAGPEPGLSFPMTTLSLGPTLPWESMLPPGKPWSIIVVRGGEQKGLYFHLEDADGALAEVPDPVEDVQSPELEQLMSSSIGRVPINGWHRGHWNSFKIIGQPRVSRVTNSWFTPAYLKYAFSTDGSVYCIKKATIQDAAERVRYPFALSNLIGMTIRHHRLNSPQSPLRHFIFYNVENQQAWGAMCCAFAAAGISLPELSSKGMIEEEETESRQSRHRSMCKSKKVLRKQLRPQMPSVWVTIGPLDPAWEQLHNNNPFTKVLNQVRASEWEVGLPYVVAYTLIAVAHERWSLEQTYWSALIAHLDPPVEAGKGKGKDSKFDPSVSSSSSRRHVHH